MICSLMILQKAVLRLFAGRGRISHPPPFKMNSDTSTPIFGRLTDFQISCLQPFEMIDELFADTVVICNHETVK